MENTALLPERSAPSVTRNQPPAKTESTNPNIQPHARTGTSRLVLAGLAVVVFAAGWLAGSGLWRPAEKETLPPELPSPVTNSNAVVVTTQPVNYRPVQRAVEALGTLHGFEEISVRARVEGRVRKLSFDVADRVQPGAPLLEIEPTDYELAVEQAKRALQVELAELGLKVLPGPDVELEQVPTVMLARARMENAQSRIERVRKLLQTGAVSTEEADNATSEFRVTQSEYAHQLLMAKAGLAQIQLKEAALAIAEQQLKETRIQAPTPSISIPGLGDELAYAVTDRSVAEGSLVQAGAEVCKLVINQVLKLRAPVPERYSADIQLGQQVEIHTSAFDHPFRGTVSRINPAADPVTRTFEVEIQVPNPEGTLKPGSFATADILTHLDPQAATVPLSAVTNFAGINKIFLLEENQAQEVQVDLGVQTTEFVEITRPTLPTEAMVITSGHSALADGVPVVVRDVEEPAAASDSKASTTERAK